MIIYWSVAKIQDGVGCLQVRIGDFREGHDLWTAVRVRKLT